MLFQLLFLRTIRADPFCSSTTYACQVPNTVMLTLLNLDFEVRTVWSPSRSPDTFPKYPDYGIFQISPKVFSERIGLDQNACPPLHLENATRQSGGLHDMVVPYFPRQTEVCISEVSSSSATCTCTLHFASCVTWLLAARCKAASVILAVSSVSSFTTSLC